MYTEDQMKNFINFPATQGGYTDMLLIKDNKVIGKGKWASGDEHSYNINFPEDILENILNNDMKKQLRKYKHAFKWISLVFNKYTGDFIRIWPVFKTSEEYLSDLRVIEEYVFNAGIGPDTFKNVEGYGKGFK